MNVIIRSRGPSEPPHAGARNLRPHRDGDEACVARTQSVVTEAMPFPSTPTNNAVAALNFLIVS